MTLSFIPESGGGVSSSDTILSSQAVVFTAESNKRWTQSIVGKVNKILRARVWIDTDPGIDFNDNFILNVYTNSDYRAENKLRSFSIPLVYRKLSIATTGVDKSFTVGGTQAFQPEDLIIFLGSPVELNRVGSVNPNLTVDNIDTAYGIGTGVSLVSEYDSSVFTDATDGTLYFELIAPSNVTLSLNHQIEIEA